MNIRLLPIIVLMILLAACAGTPAGDTTPTQAPPSPTTAAATPAEVATQAEPPPAATAPPPQEPTAPVTSGQEEVPPPNPYPAAYPVIGEPRDLFRIASDELKIVGTLYTPLDPSQPWPGVMLLHMLNRDRSDWDELVVELTQAGYAVLAVDMRGHGETGGEMDWGLAKGDLEQMWSELRDTPNVDQSRTAIIGGSIGANMALVTATGIPEVNTTILLSPGLDYQGVKTEEAIVAYGDRPVLIVASSEDSYAASSSETLSQAAGSNARLEIYSGAGHGTDMLSGEPALTDLILSWLGENL